MNGSWPPGAFEFRGLRCISAPGQGRWYYLPLSADVRRDPGGKPQLTIVDLGATGYLMFGATWDAGPDAVEALRDEVAQRVGEPTPDRVVLAFAPVEHPRCHALLGDGSGSFETVATSETSGMPPYDAVFNLSLRVEQLVQARAALEGRPDLLAVEYVAGLPLPVVGTATLSASTAPLVARLCAEAEDLEFRQQLEDAVVQGIATVTVDVPEPYTGQLATTLYDRVLAEAARALPSMLTHPAPGDLRVSVSLEEHVTEPVRGFADIGSIVAEASTRTPPGGPHAAD